MTPRVQRLRLAALLIGTAVGVATFVGSARSGPSPAELRQVDWASVTLPGSICGAKQPIHLLDHRAAVASTRWPRHPRITVDSGLYPIRYGDLDGDGREEAALGVDCNNGGGTADGVLLYVSVVFKAGEHAPIVVGVVTPRRQPPHERPTLLTVTIRRGEVVAHESFYGLSDSTCCPSGRATTIWRYHHITLTPVRTTIIRNPR